MNRFFTILIGCGALAFAQGQSAEHRPFVLNGHSWDNQQAFIGARRLWPGADLIATSYGTSWRIARNDAIK